MLGYFIDAPEENSNHIVAILSFYTTTLFIKLQQQEKKEKS